MLTIERHCPCCHDDRIFEQPPCADGHGTDCTEWCCADCGAGVLIGVAGADVVPATAAAA